MSMEMWGQDSVGDESDFVAIRKDKAPSKPKKPK